MLSNLTNPPAEKGLRINKLLVAGCPKLSGFILTPVSIFLSAVASPCEFLRNCAPVASA